MESGLTKAFMGVYNSSKAIIKNNQRHLYCNMLDLLARTTKTTGQTYLNKDDFMLFWIADILPLIFDQDTDIQKSAIAAMETIAAGSNFTPLHNTTQWNEIKSNLVQNYSKEINKYREGSNSCWYKIWCILIRILDKEIIKGASTINTFLSIVELGFRSPDYNVRVEAFYCWKVLIEIFAKNNEICSQKRIRLICIPLKSSHSKTTQAAAIKLKVWWYLITTLHTNIEQYVDGILDPFFAFCCASKNRNGSCSSDFKEMAILCLIAFLGNSTKLVKKRMDYFEIEVPIEPLITKNIMIKSWKAMIAYVIEAVGDCESINVTGIEFAELLLRYMLINILSTENMDCVSIFFDNLNNCRSKNMINNIQKFVCSRDFSSYVNLVQCDVFLGKFLSAVVKLILLNDLKSSSDSIEELVKCIFNLNQNRIKSVFEEFLIETQNTTSKIINTVIETWKFISASMIKNLRYLKKLLCDSILSIMHEWILWPLKIYAEEGAENIDNNIFDEQFNCLLSTVFDNLSSVVDKNMFLSETSALLKKIYSFNRVNPFDSYAYFTCFVNVIISTPHRFKQDEELVSTAFDILKFNLSQKFNNDNFEVCTKCLKCLVSYLGENAIETHFGDIKDAWSQIVNYKRNNNIDQSNYETHRRQFLESVKKVGSKTQYNKIRNYLENDDLFVIIPAVWSLNPDKLTERQKEKFFEKSDIPALYNDMSQSQDTFIKPWTPSKIVIAKGHVDEIVIGNDKPNLTINQDESKDISPKTGSFRSITEDELFKTSLREEPAKTKLENIAAVRDLSTKTSKTRTIPLEIGEVPSNSNLDDYVEHVDAIILKDTSSPPDRKQTNNSTSPLVKPKTTHLTGRGAQLINMIRNKKHENYTNTKQVDNTSTPISKMEANREKLDSFLNTSTENDLRPSPINLLVFSKTLPSPCASPSVSILKRKHGNESVDDIYDSQPSKHKRVSFHDPPVSVTKEYLKDEESKANSKRCLLMDQELKAATKHLLRRSAKIDNQGQIDNFSDIPGPNGTSMKRVKSDLVNCEEKALNCLHGAGTTLVPKTPAPLVFKSELDILNYIVNRYPIEEVYEKYLCDDKSDKIENDLSKLISKHMNSSHKFKTKILEVLSEQHPKDILDYAIQENLATVVCDRLNSHAIVDYVCTKSQTNISCRTRLLQELQDILNHDKFMDEKWEFIQKALLSKHMSDQQLLNLIEMLFESKRKHQRVVSESAVDSSTL